MILFSKDGIGPRLVLNNMIHAGFFPTDLGSNFNTIEISETIVNRLNNAASIDEFRYWQDVLIRTIIHETAHWAWWYKVKGLRSGFQRMDNDCEPYEMGISIEKKIWGETKSGVTDSDSEYDPLNNPYWNASGDILEDPEEVWERITGEKAK